MTALAVAVTVAVATTSLRWASKARAAFFLALLPSYFLRAS